MCSDIHLGVCLAKLNVHFSSTLPCASPVWGLETNLLVSPVWLAKLKCSLQLYVLGEQIQNGRGRGLEQCIWYWFGSGSGHYLVGECQFIVAWNCLIYVPSFSNCVQHKIDWPCGLPDYKHTKVITRAYWFAICLIWKLKPLHFCSSHVWFLACPLWLKPLHSCSTKFLTCLMIFFPKLRILLNEIRLGIREGERGKKRKKECSMHVPAALIAPAGQVHHCGWWTQHTSFYVLNIQKECSMRVPAALIAPIGQVHHCGWWTQHTGFCVI